MGEHILDGEPATPGLTQQVNPLQSESASHCPDLGHEALHPPERPVVGLVRFATAKLIVEYDRAISRQRFERLQVIMARAGSAVQDQQRRPSTADATIPDPIAVHTYSAFLNVHFHPPLGGEFRIAAPNARCQPLPEAEARHERKL